MQPHFSFVSLCANGVRGAAASRVQFAPRRAAVRPAQAPPSGGLAAYAILLYQFRRYFRLPERPIKGGKVTGSITY